MDIMAHRGSKGQISCIQLKKKDLIHFIGISGTAMAGMAGILKSRGFVVQGSDSHPYPPMTTQLEQTNIPLMKGYSKDHIHSGIKLAVIGNSISNQNKEAQEVMKTQIPYVSLPQMIREALIGDKKSLVISGTHGKTTTSSLTAWTAWSLGYNPDFLIGGIPNNFDRSFKSGHSSLFVIEGDEYNTSFFDKRPKFIHYQPSAVILTSIEFDHADIYEDINKVKHSFELLAGSLPQDGLLVVNNEDQNIQSILPSSQKKITYGISTGDYTLKDRTPCMDRKQQFLIQCPDQKTFSVQIPMFGLHNAMNTLAVFSLGSELGWDREKMAKSFKTFKGVRRRFQVLFEHPRAVLIEDFAHHPTAAGSTLSALKERYPDYDIIVVFEPRSASSRRNVFQKQYAHCFSKADQVFSAPPFREFEIKEEDRFSSLNLVRDLRVRGTHAEFHKNVEDIANSLIHQIKNKSVIVVMSNGPFGGIHQLLKNKLSGLFGKE